MGTRRTTQLTAPLVPQLVRSALGRRLLAGQMVADGAHIPPDDLAAIVADVAACPSFEDALGPVDAYSVPEGTTFDCPVTIAWGDRDYLLLFGPQSRRARERLPQVNHVTLYGCGHLPMWDDAATVADTILATTRARSHERSGLAP
jgi:pimeloyl-ACP methyl ester carboxylesterase